MEQIEPNHFDAVVVTSGLPELLIASALARAGKSVLVLDASESYGASWSSLSGSDFLHNLVNRALEHQQSCSEVDSAHLPQHQSTGDPGHPAADTPQQPSQTPNPLQLKPLVPLHDLVGNVAIYRHPGIEEALANKQLIVDLAPKVLYQDEPLVQLLVACQAHNYLEFKLVEGSYSYSSGRLRPVPASRADLFADKSLSLADKRSLGRFLSACMEAQQGFGRLKDAFDSRPLADVLAAEGLSQQLQQVVLYGIAMADTPQQLQHPSEIADLQASGSSSSSVPTQQSAGQITAAEGLAALQLYTASVGRYGGSGAFMAPCYGCGSLPEAFVRLAAVKGATTALRHGAKSLAFLQSDQQQQSVQAHDSSSDPGAADGTQAAADDSINVQQPAKQQQGLSTARVQVELTTRQIITANTVIGCRCSVPESVAGSAAEAESSSSSSSSDKIVHAVALLDRSLVHDANSLLLVFPPGSLDEQQTAVIRGVQFGPALAVTPAGKYLLYLSAVISSADDSTSGLCNKTQQPATHSKCVAEEILRPAVEALASSSGLQAVMQEAATQDKQEAVTEQIGEQQASIQRDEQPSIEAAAQQHVSAAVRPQLLAVCYYTTRRPLGQFTTLQQHQHRQQQQQEQGQQGLEPAQSEATQSSPVLLCPAAPPGYAGYGSLVQETEAVFRQHFPSVPWLTDAVRQSRPQQHSRQPKAATETTDGEAAVPDADSKLAASRAGEEVMEQSAAGGTGDAAVLDDEGDAIDELTAALAELSALGVVEQQAQHQ